MGETVQCPKKQNIEATLLCVSHHEIVFGPHSKIF